MGYMKQEYMASASSTRGGTKRDVTGEVKISPPPPFLGSNWSPSRLCRLPRPGVTPNSEEGQVRVTFLGTGSASPSKYRNGSAIWLDIPRGRVGASSNSGDCNSVYNHNSIAILLDVAEGAACQFSTCGCDLPTFGRDLLTLRIVDQSRSH